MKSRVFRTIPRKKHPNRFTERIPKGIKEEEIFDVQKIEQKQFSNMAESSDKKQLQDMDLVTKNIFNK